MSHLGGDRFAGNLLVLPRGDYFGRVDPDDVASLTSGYEAGQLDLAHHRGRSCQPRLVQAAEHFLRESQGFTGMDDLVLTEYRRISHDRAEVVFDSPEGLAKIVVVVRKDQERVHLTCRAERPTHPVSYNMSRLTDL